MKHVDVEYNGSKISFPVNTLLYKSNFGTAYYTMSSEVYDNTLTYSRACATASMIDDNGHKDVVVIWLKGDGFAFIDKDYINNNTLRLYASPDNMRHAIGRKGVNIKDIKRQLNYNGHINIIETESIK